LAAEGFDKVGIVLAGVVDVDDVDAGGDLVGAVRAGYSCDRVFSILDERGCEVFTD
jgi:hypothetical protein